METSNLSNPGVVIGYIFFIYLVVYLTRLAIIKKADLWEAVKGPDGKLQSIEIGMLIWFVFFPVLLISELFLGLTAGTTIWYSMDGIFVSLILGNLGKDYINSKRKQNDTTKP